MESHFVCVYVREYILAFRHNITLCEHFENLFTFMRCREGIYIYVQIASK